MQRLGATNANTPISVHKTSDGKTSFIMDKLIRTTMREAAAAVHKIMDKKELKLWRTHSVRVGAATILYAAGQDGPFIEIRLHWRSKTFMLYLQNIEHVAHSHAHIVNSFSESWTPFTRGQQTEING
eukprot:2823206-Ditylum_brightwellii.AAC.1